MKKLLGIVVLGLLVYSCAEMKAKYRRDVLAGFHEMNCEISERWTSYATEPAVPMQEIVQCYEKKQVYRLCLEWDTVYERYIEDPKYITKLRSAISEALIKKDEDPLKCRNPNQDAKVKLEKELKKAKSRAAAAESNTVIIQPSCHYETYTNINGALATRKVCK